MNLISGLVNGTLRVLTKIVLLVLTAVFVLSVLCIALVLVLMVMIRFLLTGRKPTIFTTVTRFHQAAQQFRPGSWPGHGTAARPDTADVVDVQAHEVRDVLSAPRPTTSTADGSPKG